MFAKTGNIYFNQDADDFVGELPVGVFQLNFDPRKGYFLVRTADNFTVDAEPEAVDTKFVERVLKMYASEPNKNLGILMSGLKGTGKTVTAKLLCNTLNLPVICIGQSFNSIEDNGHSLASYISSISQEIVVLVDEYEKIFSEENTTMLKLLDAAYTTCCKRLYILTSNSLAVNANMLGRPSRIRYIKTFGNLDETTVRHLLQKFLNVEQLVYLDEIVNYIKLLNPITVDIVKALSKEINMFGFDYDWLSSVFNTQNLTYVWSGIINMVNMRNDLYTRFVKNNFNQFIKNYSAEKGGKYFSFKPMTPYAVALWRLIPNDEKNKLYQECISIFSKDKESAAFIKKYNLEQLSSFRVFIREVAPTLYEELENGDCEIVNALYNSLPLEPAQFSKAVDSSVALFVLESSRILSYDSSDLTGYHIKFNTTVAKESIHTGMKILPKNAKEAYCYDERIRFFGSRVIWYQDDLMFYEPELNDSGAITKIQNVDYKMLYTFSLNFSYASRDF